MPHQILETCNSCGECEPRCPIGAIYEDTWQYRIAKETCNDCVGFSPSPICVKYCPIPGTIVKIEE